MSAPRPAWREWTAYAAAYLLVLQVLLTGMALGAQAAPALWDEFGGAICANAGAEGGPTAPVDGDHHLPACCGFGCVMSGAAPLSPPPAIISLLALTPVAVIAVAFDATTFAPHDQTYSPSKARAPPRAV
ncbi:DUF2946 family protein [Azorhizobium sp. AG788]|uniref:DUF2946 family protein n=1 Tax=Azorhizobium sp. AG788 TaxID=2183897 RepID=UPI003139EDC4